MIVTVFVMLASDAAVSEQGAAKTGRVRIDLSQLWIDAPGTARIIGGDVPSAESGEGWSLAGRLRITRGWYFTGAYDQHQIRYEDPQVESCPLIEELMPSGAWCQTARFPRTGRLLHDDVRGWSVGLGFEQEIGSRVTAFAEAGYSGARWTTDTDVEAVASARCIYTQGLYASIEEMERAGLVPRTDCVPVRESVREDGVKGRLGLRAKVSSRVDVSVDWTAQRHAYYIFRRGVLGDLVARNEAIAVPSRARLVFSQEPIHRSWSWFTARVDVGLSSNLGAFASAQVGGTRA